MQGPLFLLYSTKYYEAYVKVLYQNFWFLLLHGFVSFASSGPTSKAFPPGPSSLVVCELIFSGGTFFAASLADSQRLLVYLSNVDISLQKGYTSLKLIEKLPLLYILFISYIND